MVTTDAPVDSSKPRERKPSKAFATVMSLLLPGVGQIYAGYARRGLAWLAAAVAIGIATDAAGGISLRLNLVGGAGVMLFTILATVDAYRGAKRAPVTTRLYWWRKWCVALALVFVAFGVSVALRLSDVKPIKPFRLPSGSMVPTLMQRNRVIGTRPFGYVPRRGDVVIFRPPFDEDKTYIKRVIGLPGDRVRLDGSDLLVNGVAVPHIATGETAQYRAPLSPPQALTIYREALDGRSYRIALDPVSTAPGPHAEVTVPPDSYYVLGDNRDHSNDSRYWGLVKREAILYRVDCIYWPLSRATLEIDKH